MFDPIRVYSRVWLKPRSRANDGVVETGEPIASHAPLRMATIPLNFIVSAVAFGCPLESRCTYCQTTNKKSSTKRTRDMPSLLKHFTPVGKISFSSYISNITTRIRVRKSSRPDR